MYTIFLARFVSDTPEFYGFPANFSTSKKVNAIHSCFRSIGIRPLLVVTHVGNITPRSLTVRKIGNSICIIPASPSFLRNRVFQYLYGLLYSSFLVYRLRKRKKISFFFSWDYLPDTLLPLLLQGPKVIKRIIVDVEESIGADPRASFLFKIFESFIVRCLQLRTIGNNILTAKTLGVKHEGIFPGFFANSLTEEKQLLGRIEEKVFENDTVILFSGRIDSVRGAAQFVALARHFEFQPGIRFVMTGYGSDNELVEIERISPSNLSFLPSLSRDDYINLLFSADIAFNFLSEKKFASNSFPSKVVEYLLGAVVVVSNHSFISSSNRVVVIEELEEIEAFIAKYHSDRVQWRALYCKELVASEISAYSISGCVKAFRKILDV